MPRPTTDDLNAVDVMATTIDKGMADIYLQHIIEDGELLELIRREKFRLVPNEG